MTSHGDLMNLQAHLTHDFDDSHAGDAVEGTAGDGRGIDLSAFDDKHIVACAFGHVALLIEHDTLFTTSLDALDLGHDVIQVIQALHLRA